MRDFGRHRWALPVLALFYLKMNLIWLIYKNHEKGNTNRYSTVHAHAEVLNWKVASTVSVSQGLTNGAII
jgi:hypothetical protein